ncbi:MAG: hypothetical protein CMG64_04915 [Candidatus Marinimicrobia bacterium]|nr:hypothetical protein [Candidatus Neomarinimicrobiota bacterium]
MKYILTADLGGTTFNSCLLDKDLNIVNISSKDKIRHYSSQSDLLIAIKKQTEYLLSDSKISFDDVIGLSIAAPGPLDVNRNKILDTPNLKLLSNFDIVDYFHKEYDMNVVLENDANLFVLGEWYNNFKNKDIVLGITLGTGFGTGLILNGDVFIGSNGMGLEYGQSPFSWGHCEENISIKFLREESARVFGENMSPRIIEKMILDGNSKAQLIYNQFGKNLGIALSHLINVIDPQVIVFGGGLSNAFFCYEKELINTLNDYSYSFKINEILISNSKDKEKSTFLGAGYNFLNKYKI